MTQSETTTGSWSAGDQSSQQSTAEQVKDRVGVTAQAARERTSAAAGQARGRLSEQVDQRSTQAGQQLSSTAGDVRSVGEELRRQGKEGPARLADQAADRVERLGGYLQAADGDRILRDVEDFARRQPWAVVAGGLIAGFAASRFLKASSSRRYASGSQSQQGWSTSGYQTGYEAGYETSAAYPMPGTTPTGEAYPATGTYPADEYATGGTAQTYTPGVPATDEPLEDYPTQDYRTDPGAGGRQGV
jgi:hypothetical protein